MQHINTSNPSSQARLAAFHHEAKSRGYDIAESIERAEVDGAVIRFDGEASWLVTEQEAVGHADESECETFTFGTDSDGNPVRWFIVLC